MKNFWLIILLLTLPGCGMFSSAPVGEFIAEQQMAPVDYFDIAPLQEIEDRLTKAFAEQVDWDEYDGKAITAALDAVKAEFSWLVYEAQTTGYLTYYDVLVSNKKVNHFWTIAEKGLDEIVTDGAVDSDTSLIYFYVRRDIRAKLSAWNNSVDQAGEAISDKIRRYDVDQIKAVYDSIKPLIATVL